ncbi:MAG: DUF1801 domain-containing protein [Acidobacteriota bacterium]|nr:DUF1801 domain-containing protein [Acidobacteriota bacterium]
MKKTKPASRGSVLKNKGVPKDVDGYLACVPQPARKALQNLRATIRSVVPAETTEVISYGIPMFKYKGYLVGYAAFSNHCSLFPMGSSVIKLFKKELEGFPTSKGTIRFTVEKPLPTSLVRKLVKARIAQNEHKK